MTSGAKLTLITTMLAALALLAAGVISPTDAGKDAAGSTAGGDGCAQQAADEVTASAPRRFDLVEFGATVYSQRCGNCHAIGPDGQSIAPPLHNVMGRRAGSAEGYAYSFKLQDSDLVWDEKSLYEWLAQSTTATPDIRFRHAGLYDAIQRDAVVAYIKSKNPSKP